MFCENCGKEISENAKFCGFCGAEQSSTVIPAESVAASAPSEPEIVPIESLSASFSSEPLDTPAQSVAANVPSEPEIVPIESLSASFSSEPLVTPAQSVAASAPSEPTVTPARSVAASVPTPNSIPVGNLNAAPVLPNYPPIAAKKEKKPRERRYTLGHLVMCLAAAGVMAVAAGVFAGLYFSVI